MVALFGRHCFPFELTWYSHSLLFRSGKALPSSGLFIVPYVLIYMAHECSVINKRYILRASPRQTDKLEPTLKNCRNPCLWGENNTAVQQNHACNARGILSVENFTFYWQLALVMAAIMYNWGIYCQVICFWRGEFTAGNVNNVPIPYVPFSMNIEPMCVSLLTSFSGPHLISYDLFLK